MPFGVIILSDVEAASNTDILANTRLQTVPSRGLLTFELQATDNNATDNMVVSIQLPDGDTPLGDTVRAPAARAALAGGGNLNVDDMLLASFDVAQGGHTLFSCVETGDTELTWRVTFTPV